MFRCAISAVYNLRPLSNTYFKAARIYINKINDHRGFATLNNLPCRTLVASKEGIRNGYLSTNQNILDISKNLLPVPIRTVTKFSIRKGKRKTVKAAIKRFYRLDWGVWIRPKVARKKKLWTKSAARKRRLRQHVFCNSAQSFMLDKMVTKFWKKPKHYVDDPYAPYHTREEFSFTRKRPLAPE